MEQEITTTAFQIPIELLERAKRFAASQDRSASYIMRKAIEEYLNEREPAAEAESKPKVKAGK